MIIILMFVTVFTKEKAFFKHGSLRLPDICNAIKSTRRDFYSLPCNHGNKFRQKPIVVTPTHHHCHGYQLIFQACTFVLFGNKIPRVVAS